MNQFVAGFIGSPAMNLQTAPIAEDGAQVAGQTLPLRPAVRAAAAQAGLRELVIGIRPEHLHLANGSGELAGEVCWSRSWAPTPCCMSGWPATATRWSPAPRAASRPRRASG